MEVVTAPRALRYSTTTSPNAASNRKLGFVITAGAGDGPVSVAGAIAAADLGLVPASFLPYTVAEAETVRAPDMIFDRRCLRHSGARNLPMMNLPG